MMSPLICNPKPGDPRINQLVKQMLHFYESFTEYPAFQSPVVLDRQWAAMLPIIDELLEQHERIAVLEVGAGRTAFGAALGGRRQRIDYAVQDVTDVNSDYLHGIADRVHLKPIEEVAGEYDLIFSTYVFEHVATPASFLEQVSRLLRPKGWHVVFCPRYDNPAYICPSLRRQPVALRAVTALQLVSGQAMSWLDREPRFYINTDPAMLHGPWFRDADAVNVVTRRAVELWHTRNGYRCRRLQVPGKTFGLWLQNTVMLLANAFRKD